jgi:hypothetical protein
MSLNVLLLGGVLLAGLVLGLLVGYAWAFASWYNREQDLLRHIRILSEQLMQLSRRPLNLDGDEQAYQAMRERERSR